MLTWKCIYKDGTIYEQFNADCSENSYKNIQFAEVITFSLFDDTRLAYSVFLHEGQRLIFRRRNFIQQNEQGERRWLVYVIGYQFNDSSGKNHKVINYIYEDGHVELDDHRDNLEVLPEEKLE